MTEKTTKLLNHLAEGDIESFKKILLSLVTEKIEKRFMEQRERISSSLLEQSPDAAKADAEKMKADAEKQALFVDPLMAKEFFLFDLEYKGHTITVKSLGTGIGKPLVTYIDGQNFEVFTDKEIAKKEAKAAIDKMEEKGITDLKDLRKTSEQIKKEVEMKKSQEAEEKAAAAAEKSKEKTKKPKSSGK